MMVVFLLQDVFALVAATRNHDKTAKSKLLTSMTLFCRAD
jgi:hypothetical protein